MYMYMCIWVALCTKVWLHVCSFFLPSCFWSFVGPSWEVKPRDEGKGKQQRASGVSSSCGRSDMWLSMEEELRELREMVTQLRVDNESGS